MRSEGQVRFVRISSGKQIAAVGGASAVLAALLLSVSGMAALRWIEQGESEALHQREVKVANAEKKVRAARKDFDAVADDLALRQQFIEEMVDAHIADLPEAAEAGETLDAGAKNAPKISADTPRMRLLAKVEANQDAFVARLTAYANQRSEAAEQEIRKLGLNPRALAVAERSAARGGPLTRLVTSADGSVDERFKAMGASLARMDALEASLARLPQVMPAHVAYQSSSFGYRSDPFTGGAAFHAGIDFPGPMGSPIYAAAPGRVSFVGRRAGYGNLVEISHGNGLTTRYAHLSRFTTQVGAKVDGGTQIAAMGSTGRSTGSHLHFEVRVNGRAVNPRPFLQASEKAE